MRIGIDFDNTIVEYGDIFMKQACRLGWIKGGEKRTKQHVRDLIRKLPDGEMKWKKLQGLVYGKRIIDANPFEGVMKFVHRCRSEHVDVFIISHKTEYAEAVEEKVNLRDKGEPTRVAKELIAKHKKVDIVVHNVGGGLGQKGPLDKVEDWNAVWQFNVGIAIEINSVLIPEMKKHGWGRVVHISSITAELGDPSMKSLGGSLAYAAAKAYLNAYIKGLGREMAKDNIVVSGVMPGVVLSKGKHWDKLKNEKPELVDEFLNHYYPIGRFGSAEEISPFVVLLASQQASFAAGSIIPISGGRV